MNAEQRTFPGNKGEALAEVRAKQVREEVVQRTRASYAVNNHATDPTDRAMLLAMLGLEVTETAGTRGGHLGQIT
jgi:hypothetical protein